MKEIFLIFVVDAGRMVNENRIFCLEELKMYNTIKAHIDHGHIIPLEPDKLPDQADALITIVTDVSKDAVQQRKNIDKLLLNINLKLKKDPREWQKKIRLEWDR